ncbi:MAG: hypothetical protein M3Q05_14720 [Bacteroidota bacterium]|nr:hypothetical protein [Bacteroidota bacterium]
MSSLEIPGLKTKQELIDKIVAYPLEFTEAEFKQLVSPELQLNFADLRQLLLRIFDLNEAALQIESDTTTGILGLLNKLSTYFRQKRYYQLIKKGFRNPKYTNHKVIVAEGDSWFQFPFFIKDIVDWLNKEPHYAVYSIAYGGDWFTNILYDEKYIEELSIHRPEVFLISGGGNDLLSFNRLAIMVKAKCTSPLRPLYALEKMLAQEDIHDREDILIGCQYLTKDFYSFIWTIKAQYNQLFQRLNASGKFTDMQIITQGYDYAIPTYKTRWKKWYTLQPILNRMSGSGKWLKRPLMIKGITDEGTSRKIIKAIIFEVNYMFAELAHSFPNVYHIDCRGTAKNFNDWFDELHLHSEKFKRIAEAYKRCIENPPKSKIIKVEEQQK